MKFPIVDLSTPDREVEPTLEEQATAALYAERDTLRNSLRRILNALDIDDDEDGWEDDAVDLIGRLQDLEEAALEVHARAQADPVASRYLVPAAVHRALVSKLDVAPIR